MKWLLNTVFGSFFGKLFGFFERLNELERAKKQGADEQSLKNQEKANEQLKLWQDIDNHVSDDDAIDGLFSDRESK